MGKSSISAALTQQLLGKQDPTDGSWLGPASAVHFVKHSDQRRLEPVRMIKSLVYQLAVRWGGGGKCGGRPSRFTP